MGRGEVDAAWEAEYGTATGAKGASAVLVIGDASLAGGGGLAAERGGSLNLEFAP